MSRGCRLTWRQQQQQQYAVLNTVLNRALLATLYAFGEPVAMY
jgi:hypothetical protein